MVQADELYQSWHWLMFAMVDVIGPELIWVVGLEALGYPPTWVTTIEERDLVEAALQVHFLKG